MNASLPPADWFAPVVEPGPRPAPSLVDPLQGAVPTWRLDEEPIYLETVRDLGVPGSLMGPAPRDVVEGEVVDTREDGPADPTSTGGLTLIHTQPLPVVEEPPAPARRQPVRKPRAARKRTAS
jgi:predicted component of type VI protein secretion system